MVTPKKGKNLDSKQKPRKEQINVDEQVIANAIHLVNAFGFKPESALKMLNSGLLGYKMDKNGEIEKGSDNKAIPNTISRATYFNYQKKYTDMPEYYKELRSFAMSGYAKLAVGFQKELSYLHSMAAEIMLSEEDKMNKLHAIDVLVSKVIPAQSAFADLLREMLEENPKMMEPTKDEPNKS